MTPETVAAFVSARYRVPSNLLRVRLEPLAGGLESGVSRATLASPRGDLPSSLIVKELRGMHRREADIYRIVGPRLPGAALGDVVGVLRQDEADLLFLEDLGATTTWPWADMHLAAEVCRILARLHQAPMPRRLEGASWDFDRELVTSAEQTLALAVSAREPGGARAWRRLNDLRVLVVALPLVRHRLRDGGTAVIHGDVHPGNVLVRPQGTGHRIVLIDWARARAGSPFEDVASWLQSLGCWEPEARRRHDSLMTAYLRALRAPRRLCADVRAQYWLAGASNGLSGAVRYHLAILGDAGRPSDAQRESWLALRSWQRVMRRAAHVIRAGG
jgi:hypothetical protein